MKIDRAWLRTGARGLAIAMAWALAFSIVVGALAWWLGPAPASVVLGRLPLIFGVNFAIVVLAFVGVAPFVAVSDWVAHRIRISDRLSRFVAVHPEAVELIGLSAFMIPLGAIFVTLEYHLGKGVRAQVAAISQIAALLMITLPFIMVIRHRRRQNRVRDRIRVLYVLACECLAKERTKKARRLLRSIRRQERQWRFGNSGLYRLAYTLAIVILTSASAAVHFVTYSYIDSQSGYWSRSPDQTLMDTLHRLGSDPITMTIFAVMSLLFGFAALGKLRDLREEQWSDFYGERLAQALLAERHVSMAPQHEGRQLPLSASARELLGLPETFSQAELRKAWVRLARELHPDRWVSAGAGVREMKEAALKRVNAARDELLRQAWP